MTVQENIAKIREWLRLADAGFDGDFERFFSSDYIGHVSGRLHSNLRELQAQERGFAAAFDGAERKIEDLWGSDDKVVLRVTTRARHVGAFNGVEATNRHVSVSAIVIYRFVGSSIVESWGEVDFAGLWRQLTESRESPVA